LQRDILEEADNHYWSSLLLGSDYEVANESLETVIEHVQLVRERTKQDVQIVEAVLVSDRKRY